MCWTSVTPNVASVVVAIVVVVVGGPPMTLVAAQPRREVPSLQPAPHRERLLHAHRPAVWQSFIYTCTWSKHTSIETASIVTEFYESRNLSNKVQGRLKVLALFSVAVWRMHKCILGICILAICDRVVPAIHSCLPIICVALPTVPAELVTKQIQS